MSLQSGSAAFAAAPPARLDRFSYADPDTPALQKAVIRTLEFVGGQRRLKRLYLARNDNRRPGESFFDVAVRLLGIDVRLDATRLAATPATGPVIFVANHPYGVLDGIVLAHLAAKVRPDVKILAHSVLYRVPEARDMLLPVDFAGTEAALATNLRTRTEALATLKAGGAIGIFPGGGVATSESLRGRRAFDLPWAPFVAKLVSASGATVMPVYFSGQNSRLFQLASHLSLTLRLSLIFRETKRRIGESLDVAIGAPITYGELATLDRESLLNEIRRRTFALAPSHHDWQRQGRIRVPRRTQAASPPRSRRDIQPASAPERTA